ncbi:GumC family protein [Sphingobium sp. CCH11-B1]|uniref:GumC family protein n=1 Tax=Sphingobium sp. CCH11-B1 TaxID=1768781 RepID=UPI00082E71DF|nr:polysaccharide biosynthesis tyrosine autokinase [Sphingobium sp. CCH11-B1]MEA3389267.1 polysaccharide biosynthesis tyrosine autokinase [Pseudomonadota bacterium]
MMRSVFTILRRRWLLLAIVSGGLFLIGASLIFMMTPKYVAVTRLKIDPSQSAAIGKLGESNSYPDQAIVDTEVSVMRSRDIARIVARKLNLSHDPEFTKDLRRDEEGGLSEEDALADALLRATSADREKATYVVQLSAKSVNPEKAATIANAFAAEYIEASLGRRTGTAERQSQFLDKKMKDLAAEAASADERLAQYRAAAGVVDSERGGSSLIDQQIAPLSAQLATAQSEAAAASAKVAAAEAQIRSGGMDNVSAVLNSEVIRNLRTQRAQIVAEQGEVLTRYGPKHPETQKVTEQLASLDRQIQEEARRVIGGLRSEASAAAARAGSLSANLGRLRGEQTAATRSSAQADTYKRQAEMAEANYNRIAEQAQLASQAQNSSISQAQIIEKASPPIKPAQPKKALFLAVALMFAVAAGVGTITGVELLSSGMTSIADMSKLGLYLMASVPRLDAKALKTADGNISPASYVILHPMSAYAESFRTIRRSLSQTTDKAPQVVAVISTLPDEGKTVSSLSLARVLALSGERTLLIDTDLRRATMQHTAGVTAKAGLVEVLHGEARLDQAIVKDPDSNLDLLVVTSSLFSPEDVFSGESFAKLLQQARENYDRIILDTPPFLGVTDARTIAARADAAVLAVRWNSTSAGAVRHALSLMALDQTPLAGAIYTMAAPGSEVYGALYYSRKYNQYYSN